MLRTLSRSAVVFELSRRAAARTHLIFLLVLVAAVLISCAAPPKQEPAPAPAPPPPPPKTTAPPPPAEAVLYVTSVRLNLRGCPLTKCEVLRVLTRNEKVVLVGEEGAWARVRPVADDKDGWVISRFLSKNPIPAGPRPRKPVPPPATPSAPPPQQQQPSPPPSPIEEEFVR
ncbi:MAG: SH3 domain-containing protein [Nitrospirae bacterium]|nr:SH3 domain-containing protein [Nitrospirota bacterium]